jgi:hypothetical protein
MNCHICQAEAVTRCYTCGLLVCAEHGKNDVCPRCSTGFAAGDPRTDRISVEPLPQDAKHGWWRPQEAEEYTPSACYECKGLARLVCRNCRAQYCAEHAGSNGLCQACGRSANLGLFVAAAVLGTFFLLFACNWLYNWLVNMLS